MSVDSELLSGFFWTLIEKIAPQKLGSNDGQQQEGDRYRQSAGRVATQNCEAVSREKLKHKGNEVNQHVAAQVNSPTRE